MAAGEQVGHDKLCFALRMNKAVVVFVKDVCGVLSFIPNKLLENELPRFGKFASSFKTVSLGCKDPKLKHVQSLRRQVFMFLDSPTQTLEVSCRVKHGDGSYMVYASSGQMIINTTPVRRPRRQLLLRLLWAPLLAVVPSLLLLMVLVPGPRPVAALLAVSWPGALQPSPADSKPVTMTLLCAMLLVQSLKTMK